MGKRREEGFTADAAASDLEALMRRKRKPAPRMRVKRGVLSVSTPDTRRTVVEHRDVIDEFGELADLKREALKTAHALGHQMMAFHARSQDRYGRQDAFCADCNRSVTVSVEAPTEYNLPRVYGKALTEECDSTLNAGRLRMFNLFAGKKS